MIERIISSGFHRNVVTGASFGAFVVEMDENVVLLATMEGRDAASCRVVCPLDLSKTFRGDVISEALVEMLPAE